MLSFMYRIFAKDYKVYLFDRRPIVDKGITVRDFANDVALIMDELKITNADVIGVSEGGMIGEYLAIDRPDLVNKLVLVVTLSRNNEIVNEVINKWKDLTLKEDYKELIKDMAYKMYSSSYLKRYKMFLPLLTLIQKPKDTNRFINLLESCLTCNAYEELDKITCPTLVIGGELDKIVGKESSIELANKLSAELYIYEGLGHALYEEAKDFNKRVYEFLMK